MAYKFNPTTGQLDTVADPAGSSNDIQLNLNGGFGVVTGFSWVSGELQVPGDIKLNDGGTFTTTLQCVAPTANRTQTFPDASGTVALVAGSSGQLMFNNAGALEGLPSLTADAQNNLTFSQLWIQSTNGAASAPAHALTGTWFSGGTTTTTKPQFLIEPAGTTSNNWSTAGTGLGVNAPSGFTGDLVWAGLNGVDRFTVNRNGDVGIFGHLTAGGSAFAVRSNTGDVGVYSSCSFGFSSAGAVAGATLTLDTVLRRDAANTLAQRNGTNAQAFRVYNTFTSATNFERLNVRWTSNEAIIDTEAGSGGGTLRGLKIGSASTNPLGFYGATPIVQPAAVADATDNASAITQLNLALARLRSLGLLAT